MKVEVKDERTFNPIELNLTIESKEEAQALYAIFNHTHNASLLGYNIAESIRAKLGSKFCVDSGEIANGVTYRDYYN